MTARGVAPPVVEDGTEPNPPPQWRPGDPDPRMGAPAPAPPPPPPPVPPAAARTPLPQDPERAPAPGRSEAGRRPDAEPGPEGMATFLDRLVRGPGREVMRPRSRDADDADDDAPPPAPSEQAGQPAGSPTGPDGSAAPSDAPPPLTGRAAALEARLRKLSPAELDTLAHGDTAFARAVQEQIDRRAFTAQRQLADQGRQGRQQQLEQLRQQEQQLRQTDVYEAARVRDQMDAMASQDNFLTGVFQAVDRVMLDPLMLALPEAERTPILEAMPPGVEGRKYVTEQAVARIKANAAAEAERKLRRSPAFRKQVLAELRGEPVEEDDEPELGADRRSAPRSRTGGKSSMDAFIRRGFGQAV